MCDMDRNNWPRMVASLTFRPTIVAGLLVPMWFRCRHCPTASAALRKSCISDSATASESVEMASGCPLRARVVTAAE